MKRVYDKTKFYVVEYLSESGMHYLYRCTAQTKAEAKKNCHAALGVKYRSITDCWIEE